jgi:hypothetical protein
LFLSDIRKLPLPQRHLPQNVATHSTILQIDFENSVLIFPFPNDILNSQPPSDSSFVFQFQSSHFFSASTFCFVPLLLLSGRRPPMRTSPRGEMGEFEAESVATTFGLPGSGIGGDDGIA